jgi:hypothetical protein
MKQVSQAGRVLLDDLGIRENERLSLVVGLLIDINVDNSTRTCLTP